MKKIILFILILLPVASAFSQTTTVKNKDKFTLTAVGDISHPSYLSFAAQYYKLAGEKYSLTRQYFINSDIAFANLETPYTYNKAILKKTYPFSTKPEELKYVFEAGFNLFSLANNHTYDAGLPGIIDTEKYMRQNADEFAAKTSKTYAWAGASSDKNSVGKPAFFSIPGKNFEFIFLSYGNNSSAYVNTFSTDKCRRDVANLRKKYPAHIIIVSIHSGTEYSHVPEKYIVNSYRSIIDAGASIILGHHPHVLQGIENYSSGVICYSLGNFAFGSKTSRHLEKNAKLYGMIADFDITRTAEAKFNISLEVIPLYLDNNYPMKVNGKTLYPKPFIPFVPEKPFSTVILDSIAKWSKQIPGNRITFQKGTEDTIVSNFESSLGVRSN
ncbi:MAG: CapA family protein [Spirochaetes bacterium]|nr:CapA family protein [Spirochaetota bacterium]